MWRVFGYYGNVDAARKAGARQAGRLRTRWVAGRDGDEEEEDG